MTDKSDKKKTEAKQLCTERNWTHAAIASHLGVSTRTVERWASAGGWGGLKQSKVISISRKSDTSSSDGSTAPPRRERAGVSRDIDELTVVNGAIADLSAALSAVEDERALGGLAGGLVRLLEYRRKTNPPTVGELADQLIALGIDPTDFVMELRRRWQLEA